MGVGFGSRLDYINAVASHLIIVAACGPRIWDNWKQVGGIAYIDSAVRHLVVRHSNSKNYMKNKHAN